MNENSRLADIQTRYQLQSRGQFAARRLARKSGTLGRPPVLVLRVDAIKISRRFAHSRFDPLHFPHHHIPSLGTHLRSPSSRSMRDRLKFKTLNGEIVRITPACFPKIYEFVSFYDRVRFYVRCARARNVISSWTQFEIQH